ncbi:acyltransferase domain-containing protein [Planotetraspora silvatica]|uniref:acyltransferase domain-containing protein n=1 Tax=Planotetraspora silvatica TaxID=234614 RepID=UPI0023B294F0|nr:acyltransferase domain-containing protein [Planotetraspora silvatica]
MAAAHIAGALSLADAAAVVALRSQAIATIGATGRMASVPLPADEVRRRLADWGDRLSVGAVNGPAVTVVSGEATTLTEFVTVCRADDLDVREVRVDYASHSPLVEAVKPRLIEVLSDIRPRTSDIAFSR